MTVQLLCLFVTVCFLCKIIKKIEKVLFRLSLRCLTKIVYESKQKIVLRSVFFKVI